MKWNLQWFWVHSKTDWETYTLYKQIQLLSRIKTIKGQSVRRVSPVGKKKVYGGKDLPNSQVLSSEWKNVRVRHDDSGDSEDELLCVIGGERDGDSIWRN